MEMKPFKHLLSRKEAIDIILNNIQRINRKEIIPIYEAVSRVIAQKAIAKFNVPPFNRSSMDGYAVQAEDTFGASTFSPKKLTLKGIQQAGELFKGQIGSGECIQVATGSPIPKGSNAVVMVEYTNVKNNIVEIYKALYPGENISPEGEDIKIGEVIIEEGEKLTPAKIGALASLNIDKVEVYEKPRVAVFSTGSEVKPLQTEVGPGQIYDINSYTISSVILNDGCVPIRKGIVPDEFKSIEKALVEVKDYDLGVFSGGSSVGTRDLFADAVGKKGRILFHGVQVKPGKPTLFGLINETPIFGMPGYPTSCLSNSYIFLTPAIRKLAGLPPPFIKQVKAKMGTRIVSSSGREQLLTVKLDKEFAYPVFKKSGAITSMVYADGYVVLPINLDVIEKGDEITVILLD